MYNPETTIPPRDPVSMLHIDSTTIFSERGRLAHGTTRVARGLATAFATHPTPGVAFCRFQRLSQKFLPVDPAEILRMMTELQQTEVRRSPPGRIKQSRVSALYRQVERLVRSKVRDPLLRCFGSMIEPLASSRPFLKKGSILLIPDGINRHDFQALMDLRHRHGVRLVFLHFDLLATLPKGDPRLTDPTTIDLPGTDFVAREADLVLAISQFSAGILLESLASRDLRCPPIEVIPLAGQLEAQGMEPVAGLEPGCFVLTVGDIVARKNHALLIDVWEHLLREGDSPPKLVMAGSVHTEGVDLVKRISESPELEGSVHILPSASDAQLAWLYAKCRFTVFPSLKEGFGLPVAESLSAGKPCIASNATSIPEASQGAAIHLDPHDTNSWVDQIRRLAFDQDALENECRLIKEKYRPVSWRDTQAACMDFINDHLAPKA